jgi:hypothetical protein
MKRLIFALIILIFHCRAQSELVLKASKSAGKSNKKSCTAIDLLAQSAPLSFWNERRDQKGSDWCGSFSLAYVLSHKTKQPISSLQIAATYHRDRQESSAPEVSIAGLPQASIADQTLGFGGRPCDLFDSVKKNGFCPEQNFEASAFPVQRVQHFFNTYRHYSGSPAIRICTPQEDSADASRPIADLKPLSAELNKTNFQNFIAELANRTCSKEIVFPEKKLKCVYRLAKNKNGKSTASGKSFLSGDADSRLEKGVMPILTFEQGPLYSDGEGPTTSPHAVPITARRWNDKLERCEYRIRNSAGPDECAGYAEKVTCADKEVISGQVWISGKFIDETGYYLTTIE